MLHNAFYALLKMSIFASAAVIIIIGLRLLLGRKLPKYFCHILWIFVLLRLLIPFSLTSMFSIFNVIPVPETAVSNTEYTAADKLPNISESENETAIKSSTETDTETKELTSISKPAAAKVVSQKQKVNLNDIFPWIWIAGLLSLLLYSVYSYVSAWTKLKKAVIYSKDYVYDCKERLGLKRNIKMYVSDKIPTPIVFGLIKPKIILPVNTAETSNEAELRYITTHELVHIKRFDNIIKILWVISLCIYWFNPMIWLGFIISQKDMEMSCDEKVLSLNNEDIRSEYASSLINLAAKQNMIFNGGILAFGESNIKSRVKGIMKFKKPKFIIGILSFIILAAIGLSLLTNGNRKAEAQGFDKSKVQDYQLETVIINDCTAKEGPSESYKAAGSLKYGDVIFVSGKYNDWLGVSSKDGSVKYWVNSKYVISESKHTDYNLGIITKDKVTVGTEPLVKGNLIQVLIKDKDKSCVTIRDIDVKVGKTGWIDNTAYTMAKGGVFYNQAYLKKGAQIYEKPSLSALIIGNSLDHDLFVNIKEEKDGWVLISSHGHVNGWAEEDYIYMPSAAAGEISTNVISPSVSSNVKAKLLKSVQEMKNMEPGVGPWEIKYYNNGRIIIYNYSHIIAINVSGNNKGIYSIIDLRNLKVGSYQGSIVAEMYPSPDGLALILGTGTHEADIKNTEGLYLCNLHDGSVKELETNYNLADNKVTWYRNMTSSSMLPWGVLIKGPDKKIFYDMGKQKKLTSIPSGYDETAIKTDYIENLQNITDYDYLNWYKIDEENVIGSPYKKGVTNLADLKLSDFRIVKINLKTKKEEVLFKIN
ncbi:MAG: M56 family metallopeptidase [Clostridiaceae bacterium]